MIAPRRATLIIAGLATLAILLVAGIAVWRHPGGGRGDDLATRSAVMAPVDAAVADAAAHSVACSREVSDQTSAEHGASAGPLEAKLAACGSTARQLAEQGYRALDAVAGSADTGSTPGRDAYLDAAGSLLSIYEMQGDDFDMIYDMLDGAHANGTAMATMRSDIMSILDNGAPDLKIAQEELTRLRNNYRTKG